MQNLVRQVHRLPPQAALEHIPILALKLLNGAEVHPNFKERPEVVGVFFDGRLEEWHKKDCMTAKALADKIYKDVVIPRNIGTSYHTLSNTFDLLIKARRLFKAVVDEVDKKRKVLFIKGDDAGCGYWRMHIPSTMLPREEFTVSVASMEVVFDYLSEFDTIVVQRQKDWDTYYTLQKLKNIGRRIVYDIDDNLFELPEAHPARRFLNYDMIEAARACVRLADCVTTSTERMAEAVVRNCGMEVKLKIKVIPNVIDSGLVTTKPIFDEKGVFKILWAGSPTHEKDFEVCVDGLDRFMRETEDAVLLVMGSVPNIIMERAYVEDDNNKEGWIKRIETIPFMRAETYFKVLPTIRASVGIAPLVENIFNDCKSPVKWLEYAAAGVPILASNTPPYCDIITDGEDGFLVEEWFGALMDAYTSRSDKRWRKMVMKARSKMAAFHSTKSAQVVNMWKEAVNSERKG